jgi:hypothetical protein
VEKSTSFSRSQVIVIVWATMSTLPLLTSGMRSSLVSALYWTWFGLPKMAWATARIMSMSNPSKFPSRGLKYSKW